jgi:threonine/homoserine/homoserine lactone efflux protein
MEELFGFAFAGLALTGSPGPAVLSLAAIGAAFGTRRGLPCMAGIVAGMVCVMLITASGIMGIVLALPGVQPAVTALAAGYFLYLAYRIATAPPLSDTGAQRRQPSFAGGLVLSLANPKAYAAMAALFSSFVLIPARPELDIVAKIAVLVALIIPGNLAWLIAGASLTRFFRDPRTNRAVNVAFALLLLVSVAFALRF